MNKKTGMTNNKRKIYKQAKLYDKNVSIITTANISQSDDLSICWKLFLINEYFFFCQLSVTQQLTVI